MQDSAPSDRSDLSTSASAASSPSAHDGEQGTRRFARAATLAGPGSTLFTVALFLLLAAGLALSPLPQQVKPIDLSTSEAAQQIARRVLKKPKMTIQHVEEKLAGGSADGRDAPEGQGAGAAQGVQGGDKKAAEDDEERELLSTRDGRADVVALQAVTPNSPVARPALVKVDRKALVARAKAKDAKGDGVVVAKADVTTEKSDAQRQVQAPGAGIDNPCVSFEPAPEGGVRCTRTALDPLFVTLDAIAAGDPVARASVVIFGNSLIASDHVTDVVRARLVERFGDAGRGFLLPERLSKVAGRRVRTGQGTPGWIIHSFAMDAEPTRPAARTSSAPSSSSSSSGPPALDQGPFGFSGSFHESSTAGERTVWKTEGARRAKLFYLEHDQQPALRLEAIAGRGAPILLARVERAEATAPVAGMPADLGRDATVEVELPPGTTELQLVAEGKGARVFGVALEKEQPGVVVDTIGVPAASARLYLDGTDEGMFVRQLAARDPVLVTLMLGGNEVRALSYGTLDVPALDRYLSSLVDRTRQAAPNSGCLIVAPIDAAKATAAGEELATRPEIKDVIAVEQQVAKRKGCAFFNLFEAMGGAGSLSKFKAAGFLSDDLVHPTWRGGDLLGHLFSQAMLAAYVDTPAPEDPTLVSRRREGRVPKPLFAGLSFPQEMRPVVVVGGREAHATVSAAEHRPLAGVFDKLHKLERGEVDRVAIGQIGASHTAGQMWTDAMRERLATRFGDKGRGFVAVGRESKRLIPSGVRRELSGDFEIADGREVVLGGAVGVAGTKVRLEAGARFSVSFCQPSSLDKGAPLPKSCAHGTSSGARHAPGTLSLAWLFTPDMGNADVAVDGKTVAHLSPDERRLDGGSDVQFLRLPIDTDATTLEVRVAARDGRDGRDGRDDDDDSAARRRRARAAAGESDDIDAEPIGPVHLLSVVEERARPGVVLDAIGLPGTTGMTPQRWRQDLIADEVRARGYDLVVTAWGTNEAGIASLDEATYRHHFGNTLTTLLAASPGADCLIVGASDRMDKIGGEWRSAPAHDLVERVQKDLAVEHGCAFFSLRTAMGGPGSMKKWVDEGLGNPDHVHFTREGYQKLADLVVDDLLAAMAYEQALEAARAEEAAELAKNGRGVPGVDRRGG